MSFSNVVDLCSDEETEIKYVRPDLVTNSVQEKVRAVKVNGHSDFGEYAPRLGFQQSISPNGASIGSLSASNLSALPDSVPFCRQFWKAGDYGAILAPGPISRNGGNRLRVHPEFLHSNATSHKWAFGAIAELLDNAVDEVQNGATFVKVDKFEDPRNGNHALLIQDDGGGMDPESLRRCMSFGFSDKQSDSSIGNYGNGFKTSTMRLGADAMVFSRCMNERTLTQSVGLLSYTFLRHTCSSDIIVPMVDYEGSSAGVFKRLLHHGEKRFSSNLSTILEWSPFVTEVELLKQFDDIGRHGTKILVFNLWFNDDGYMELDFESDAEDILVSGAPKKMLSQKNIADRFRYSLRVYSSILYLLLPENFRIILRGRVVETHHIADDLKYRECIKYKPQDGRKLEVFIAIGFLEGAPKLDIHGFNIYHKNRLILPFWHVFSNTNGKGRGVAGVLEANFIKPTHDKQDFERSSLYQKLEIRLKEMTVEYWNYHCHLVGYQPIKKKVPSTPSLTVTPCHQMTQLGKFNGVRQVMVNSNNPAPSHHLTSSVTRDGVRPVTVDAGSFNVDIPRAAPVAGAALDQLGNAAHHSAGRQVVTALSAPTYLTPGQFFTNCSANSQTGVTEKRRYNNHISLMESSKKQAVAGGVTAGSGSSQKRQFGSAGERTQMQEIVMRENEKLRAQCSEYEKTEKQLFLKARDLRSQLQEAQQAYIMLKNELRSMDEFKMEL